MSRDYGAGLAAAFQAFLTTSAQNKQLEWEKERYEKQYQMELDRLEMTREEHKMEMRRLENVITEQEKNSAEAQRIREYLTAKGYSPEQIALEELQWGDEQRDMQRQKFDMDIASARSLAAQRGAAAALSQARMAQITRANEIAATLTPEQRMLESLYPGIFGGATGGGGGGAYGGTSRTSTKTAKPEDIREYLSSPEKYLAEHEPASLPAYLTAKGQLDRLYAAQADILKTMEANSSRDAVTGEAVPRDPALEAELQRRMAMLNNQVSIYAPLVEGVTQRIAEQFMPFENQGPDPSLNLSQEERAALKKKKDEEGKDKSYIVHKAKEFGRGVAGGAGIVFGPVKDAAKDTFQAVSDLNRMDERGETARREAKEGFLSGMESWFEMFGPGPEGLLAIENAPIPEGRGSIEDSLKKGSFGAWVERKKKEKEGR